ncbi:hypothetical protein M1M92_00810 [Peptococcaceae bacterium]|nr:hypothetical protein [Peptococcaceae bacterium]
MDVSAYDVDRSHNETINVYFESYDGRYRVHFGTLEQGDDRELTWTVLEAPRGTLGTIHALIFDKPPVESIGKFRIVFEREDPYWSEIRWVRSFV